MSLKGAKSSNTFKLKSSTYDDSDFDLITSRRVRLAIILKGSPPGPGDWPFLAFFNGQIVLEGKWQTGLTLETEALPLDLCDSYHQQLVAEQPLILILRTLGMKGVKDPDPLLNVDNRAGATVDLLPLALGDQKVHVHVPLVMINTGDRTDCTVDVIAETDPTDYCKITRTPLTITMYSAHCLPHAKEGTVYLAAIGLNGIYDRVAFQFGMSLSTADASKVVWASASKALHGGKTMINILSKDRFIPPDLETENKENCNSVYWNAISRVLVDPLDLRERFANPFLIELAGVPRIGKIEVRARYMCLVDAKSLLEPGQYGNTVCAKILLYNEADLQKNVDGLLELPPTSVKASARDTEIKPTMIVKDDFGHTAYIIIRFDLTEALVAKTKIGCLHETIGFSAPEGSALPVDSLDIDPPSEDSSFDVRRIRKEGGALAVHKELGELSCRGAVPTSQSIKRSAANRLLMRVRTMLKQFPPGECQRIEWQDTVTAQHAASRRAVTASFAPQPPAPHFTPRFAAARCRLMGDSRLSNIHIELNLKVVSHPRSLLAKALRCLEEGNKRDAKNYLLQGLTVHTRNRFLLWTLGAQEYERGSKGFEMASAAFQLAVKGDISDGTTHAIGWAAVHALQHSNNIYSAFIALKRMRKAYELPKEWNKFLTRWVENSGEEETFWMPSVISSENPILIAAAFFLCLRCYSFSERLLQCYESKCFTRGHRLNLKEVIGPDPYYLKAAAYLVQRDLEKALNVTNEGIKRFGPTPMMSQMRATCLACGGWNGDCENALKDSDKAGAESCPLLLLKAALLGFKTNPEIALQRAARAHKIAPSPHSALAIARIYSKLGEDKLAERWASAAVKLEPIFSDGWAFLALLATYQRDVNKARAMLRTAKQVGPLSPDIYKDVKRVTDIIDVETLPDMLVKNLCFCDYLS